jgi:hypothetical protein
VSDAQIDPLIQGFVDMLRGQILRGTLLDTAVASMAVHFSGAQRAALDAAAAHIRSRVDRIERLRRPSSLRKAGRIAWYPGPQETDTYWPVLERYLREVKGRDAEVIHSIDESSSKVVSSLDFPGSARFSTRGLVLGYVQSGKTANFTAVISKAADCGFRVFLILSGLTNSLRKQTQERLDAELVALNSRRWHPWTNVHSDIGDYPFNVDAMLSTEHAHLAVVKKNGPRLRRLLRMLKRADRTLLEQCPVLVIDDECDQASVNASGTPDRLTAINRILRDLLRELPRVSYIGYTATPYANVLIDPEWEDDLYPRDFIISLPRPERYFGAERLFGRDLLDADEVPPDQSGLDMIRRIPDEEVDQLRPPSREQQAGFHLEVTPSLARAIQYYWLATAAKAVRGLAHEHSCMLIHTTVYAQTHLNARPAIVRFVEELARSVDRRDRTVMTDLKQLWTEEQARVPSTLLGRDPVSFEELAPHLAGSTSKPDVPVENSFSDQRLDFSTPSRRYIVIGGNVLARGLTLDGLVVSFFLRAASQYDTLMQMGRWFGYRELYEDLPRIWMTAEMADYFKDMATVEAEIRYDIEVYDRENISPREFAIRIRRHPDLAITAAGKMARAEDCQVSYAGEHIQTRKFHASNDDWLRNNWEAADRLLNRISSLRSTMSGPSVLYEKVPFAEVTRFLSDYRAHEAHRQFVGAQLNEYIGQQNTVEPGSLAEWNVAVIGSASGELSDHPLGTLGRVSTVRRSKLNTGETTADIKALMSRADAAIDLPPGTVPSGADWEAIKGARHSTFQQGRALLLLYPINRESSPELTRPGRVPLDAKRDVMGVGIVFPEPEQPVVAGYVRAPNIVSFEEAEYTEETLPDDVGA